MGLESETSLLLFPLFDHRHQPVFDRSGSFGRTQTQSKRLMQCIAFGDKIFAFLPKLLARLLKLSCLCRDLARR